MIHWQKSITLANLLLIDYERNQFFDPTYGATYFHSIAVNPWWASHPKMKLTRKIGSHKFYRYIQ